MPITPKQKQQGLDIDWSLPDRAIAQNVYPSLAMWLEAIAGDNEGNLVAPGYNRIYARIGDDTEATIIMVDPMSNAAGLQLHAPILVFWDKNENSYVWANRASIGAYNQASGGSTPSTALNAVPFVIQTANAQVPNAQVLDDLTADSIVKVTSAGALDEAVASTDYVKPNTGTNVVNTAMIADNAITNAKMADNSVNTAEIVANAVTTAKIADSNVTTAKIADANVTNAKLATDAVTQAKIANDAVGTAEIIDANVTNAKIASMAASKLTGQVALENGGTEADLSATGGTGQFLKQSSGGAAVTVGTIGSSDLTTALTTAPPITSSKITVTGEYSQVGAVTVTSTTTDTTLMSASLQWAANFFTAGRQALVRLSGYANTATNHQVIWRFKLDGTIIISANTATTTSGGDVSWWVEFIIGCATTGAGGTGRAQTWGVLGSAIRTSTSNATFSLDTTQALDVDVTGRFLSVGGSGSPSMTCTNLSIQIIG